eukprot:Hpha_TRINITY_DN15380_c1_g5::TRINITY_DN15380_c1_g5_i1::g.89628::m.89628
MGLLRSLLPGAKPKEPSPPPGTLRRVPLVWDAEEEGGEGRKEEVSILHQPGGGSFAQLREIVHAWCGGERLHYLLYGEPVAVTDDGSLNAFFEEMDRRKGKEAEEALVLRCDRGEWLEQCPFAGMLAQEGVMETLPRDDSHRFLLRAMAGHCGGEKTSVFSCDADAEGGRGLTASKDGTAKVWNVNTGELLTTIVPQRGEVVVACAWGPASKRLGDYVVLSAVPPSTRTSSVTLYDPEGHKLRQFKGHRGKVYGLSVSPCGLFLCTGGSDRTVRVWDAATGSLLSTMTGHEQAVFGTCFAPGTDVVCSVGDGEKEQIMVWRWREKKERKLVGLVEGHSDCQWSACFSPDGKSLATVGKDKVLLVVAMEGGPREEKVGERRWVVRDAHSAPIHRVEYSSDSTSLVTVGRDRYLRVWDAFTGAMLGAIADAHAGNVFGLKLLEGRCLTCGGDGKLKLWRMPGSDEPQPGDMPCREIELGRGGESPARASPPPL